MKKSSILVILFLVLGMGVNAQSRLEQGNIAYGARNYHQAISNYDYAMMTNPSNPQLLQNLADCYRITNKMGKAEKIYAQVCKNPNTPAVHFYRYGTVLQANKKYDLAIQMFAKYAKKDPKLAAQAQASCVFAKNNINSTNSAFTVLKESINQPNYDDYAPVLQPKYLAFSSARKVHFGSLPGGSNPQFDNYLYKSTRGASGQLLGASIIKTNVDVTPPHNLAPLCINANENFAVSTINQFANGVRHIREASLLLLSMEITNTIKSLEYFPIGQEFPHMSNHSASFPAFANNNNSIYFAAYNYPGGQGGFDIWVVHKQGNGWSAPINLGPNVNTPGDEVCPHITNNGDLFFASDYHKGFGGFDVFRAKKVASVWKDVRNLGNKVNSSFDDMYFVFDYIKRIGYFSSNRNNDYFNIYRATMTGNDALMATVVDNEANVVIAGTPSNNGGTPKTNGQGSTAGTNTKPNNTKPNNTYGGTPSNNNATLEKTNGGIYKPHSNTASGKTDPPIDGYGNKPTNPVNNNNTYAGNTNKPANNGGATNVGTKPTVSNSNTVPCAMNFYIGAVIDATTKRPLKGASIFIQNLKTGKEQQIKEPTNLYGEYSMILDPLTDYTILISKPGFKELIFDVNTGSGGKKTLLGTRELAGSPMLQRDKFNNIIEPDGPVVNNKPTAEELVNPPKSSNKHFTMDANGRPIPKMGYLIQVFALSSPLSAQQRAQLEKYGIIVTENRPNGTKVYRVGVFADEQHMQTSLVELKKINPNAFPVKQELDNNHLSGRLALSSQLIYPLPPKKQEPELEPMKPAPNVNTTPITKERELDNWTRSDLPEGFTPRGGGNPNPAPAPVVSEKISYKVQVGALRKAENASFSNVSHLGMIEKRKLADGITRFYIASFKTLDAAKAAQAKAEESGIVGPRIVAFKGNNQIDIKEALKHN